MKSIAKTFVILFPAASVYTPSFTEMLCVVDVRFPPNFPLAIARTAAYCFEVLPSIPF